MQQVVVVTVFYDKHGDADTRYTDTWVAALGSLEEKRRRDVAFALVDNSERASIAAASAQSSIGEWCAVELTRRPDNPGFAAAVNQAVDGSESRFVLLLNPDVMVPKSFFQQLLTALEDPQWEHQMGVIRMTHPDGRTTAGIAIGPTLLFTDHGDGRWNPKSRRVGPSGGAALIPRVVWETVGGYWSSFFGWGEDADFALRALRYNVPVADLPLRVFHQRGGTLQDLATRRLKDRLLMRNRVLLWYRHFSPTTLVILAPLLLAQTLALCLPGLVKGTCTVRMLGVLDALRLRGHARNRRGDHASNQGPRNHV